MAIFRKLHTSFWSDSFISDLDRDKKLFYIYLLTNEHTTQCGVYEITKKQIAFDLGYSIDTVSKLLEYFISTGKIKYNDKTNEIGIGNWLKYNSSTSPKVQSCINKEFTTVKDTVLIQYVKSMDTHPQEEEEEEKEEEKEKDHSLAKNIFESFRVKYPGTKRGLETEFTTFKKHKDWKECLPLLLPAIENQTKERDSKLNLKQFVPEWKNLQTWLNQRCWEIETKKPIIQLTSSYNGERLPRITNELK